MLGDWMFICWSGKEMEGGAKQGILYPSATTDLRSGLASD